jgi:hypothetical protein
MVPGDAREMRCTVILYNARLLPDLINLSCRSCGARLTIGQSLDRFACGYCGAELLVERSGGTVSLTLVEERLEGIRAGTDKTAAELAIRRLESDLAKVEPSYRSLQSLLQKTDQAIADGEVGKQRIIALEQEIASKRRTGQASQIGCFSSIIWGAILVAVLSKFGGMGVLIALATIAAVDVMCFIWILRSEPSDAEEALRYAKYTVQQAHEKQAARDAIVAELSKLEPAVVSLRKQLEAKRRIADS